MKIPNSVKQNTYKAYLSLPESDVTTKNVNLKNAPINALCLAWDNYIPERLSIMCIRCIAKNWSHSPIFHQIQAIEDQNFLLDILEVDLPIRELSETISSDVFWERCFQSRWTHFYPHNTEPRPWISLYLERFLSERLESAKPIEWNQEEMIKLMKVCSPHVHHLCIGQLQPSINEENDHIRIDIVLAHLLELQSLELSYSLKCIETNFFLGCSNLSSNDVKWLSKGLETCKNLIEFR